MVNISIITYNRLEKTKQCLESIRNNVKIPHIITIVDNNSDAKTKRWLIRGRNEYGFNLNILSNNFGPGVAKQIALDMNTCEYIFFVDNDVFIQQDCVENLISTIEEKDEKLIGVCAKIVEDGYDSLNGMVLQGNKILYVDDEPCSRNVDIVHMGATLCRGSVYKYAKFDSRFYEDLDFSLQLNKAGFKFCNCPNAIAIHCPTRQTCLSLSDDEVYYISVRKNPAKLKKDKKWFDEKWGLHHDGKLPITHVNREDHTFKPKETIKKAKTNVLVDKNDPSLYRIIRRKK